MTDLFEQKSIKPMLIGAESDPFDDPDYLFELKLDGERCIAYLDPLQGTELRNKRNMKMLRKVPELSEIHKQVTKRCILDGELIVIVDGKPDFSEIKRRSLMSNTFKIELSAAKYPACFTAYDILYEDGHPITDLPLTERKAALNRVVAAESKLLAVSRVFDGKGVALYGLAEQQDLEGVVAKRKDSRYYFDKRTKDWLKIKNLKDDDFVVCGYINKEKGVVSIVLGQYRGPELVYKGHVTMGVSRDDFSAISSHPRVGAPDFTVYPETSSGNDRAVWISPDLVCTVKFMEYNTGGGLRQPVFKGLRTDKAAKECVETYSAES